jgi:hypothetical protein
MPAPVNVTKATLTEIWWDTNQQAQSKSPTNKTPKTFQVQFNPQTLKLSYSNQTTGGDGSKPNASTQYTARQSTKLSLELWFDVTLAIAEGRVSKGDTGNKPDVRALTQEVAYFLIPQQADPKDKNKVAPPGIKFTWGNFEFSGVMDSMDENIDHFSPEGLPLRASVSIGITRQNIEYKPSSLLAQPSTPGTQPLLAANQGDSVQQMAAKAGASDWQSIATANNIDNPRQLSAGALLNFSI